MATLTFPQRQVGYEQAEAEAILTRERGRGEWECGLGYASEIGWYVIGKKTVNGQHLGHCWTKDGERGAQAHGRVEVLTDDQRAALALALAEERALRKSLLGALRAGSVSPAQFDGLLGTLAELALDPHRDVLARYAALRAANQRTPFQVKLLAETVVTGRRGVTRIRLIERNSAYSNESRKRRYCAPHPGATVFQVDVLVDGYGWIASSSEGPLAPAREAFARFVREYGPR